MRHAQYKMRLEVKKFHKLLWNKLKISKQLPNPEDDDCFVVEYSMFSEDMENGSLFNSIY